MSGQDVYPLAMNACVPCNRSKRRCDRVKPFCSTCVRSGRACLYDDRPLVNPQPAEVQAGQRESATDSSTLEVLPELLLGDTFQANGLFSSEGFRQSTIDTTVSSHTLRIFGTSERIGSTATAFFDTISIKFPIISRHRFFERLETPFSSVSADFATLCLCMELVLQHPTYPAPDMQSSLYVTVKNIISLLESTNHFLSLEIVQCRLLVAFYEIGHGIFPASSISIGACARTGRALGLNKRWLKPVGNEAPTIVAEEERRVWWAIFNLDRFSNLCNGDALFGTEDPRIEDLLPIDDDMWARGTIPESNHLTIGTASDKFAGRFARECQVSYLIGRVLRHIFNPISDRHFYADEELQLERTLRAFMPILMEEDSKYGQYCAALAVCASALFSLYDAALQNYRDSDVEKIRVIDSMKSRSITLTDFSRLLFAEPRTIDPRMMSPLIPHSLYRAALIQFQAWKQTNEVFCKQRLDVLKKVLGHFSARWLVAAKYLEALKISEIG